MLEAGPCPVTAIRTTDARRLRGRAARLRRRARRKLSQARARPPQEGRRRAAPPPRRVPRRGRRACRSARPSRSTSFNAGDRLRSPASSKGKGFQGTIKRHNFKRGPKTHGSHNYRAPGLDRRIGDAVARVQGHPRPGPDGRQARHPARLTVVDVLRREEPAARPWRGSRPTRRTRGGADRWLGRQPCSAAAPSTLERQPPSRPSFNMPLVHEAVRAELAARRQGTALDQDAAERSPAAAPSRGARREPAAPAPARRARRCGPAAAPSSARRRAATPSRSTARRGGPRSAARCRFTPSADRLRCSTPACSTRPSTSQAWDLLADWDQRTARRSSLLDADEANAGKSFRNLERVAVMPGGRCGRRRHHRRRVAARLAGGAAVDRHASARRRRRRDRRGGVRLMEPTQVIIRPVVSEKSYVLAEAGKYTFRVHDRRAQDPDPPGRRAAVRRQGSRRRTSSVKSKPKRRGASSGRHALVEEGDRPGPRGRHDPDLPGSGGS